MELINLGRSGSNVKGNSGTANDFVLSLAGSGLGHDSTLLLINL